MSDTDTVQAVNPEGVPAESPPATQTATPEPPVENPSGDDTAAESQAEREKPKGGFQRRISELTRNQRELRRQLEEATLRAERLERTQKPQATEAAPKRDDFASWDEYEDAKVRHVTRQAIAEAQAEAAETQRTRTTQQQVAELNQEWNARLEDAREKFEDIDEYVDTVGTRINEHVATALKGSELGPELVRHLGQNPKELDRIASLPPVQGIKELGKLEARLQVQPKASSAPAPATPVKTTTPLSNALRDDSDVGSWMKARNAQIRKG